MNFNPDKCHSIRSKLINEQCQYKKKPGHNLCGVHLKCKDVQLFYVPPPPPKEDKEEDGKIDKIYNNSTEFLFDLFEKNMNLSVYSIRQSIKSCGLSLKTKQSRQILIEELRYYYKIVRYYNDNLDKIVRVQRYFRKKSELVLKSCVNDMDILTFSDIHDIPKPYLYIYKDERTGLRYAYDIRTLVHILKTENPTCPYTCREYTIEEKIRILEDIKNKVLRGLNLNIDQLKLTPEEETEMRMKDIFHKINLLGNYTSYLWFKNLTLAQQKLFYNEAESLWNFKLGLGRGDKMRYVRGGSVFETSRASISIIDNLNRLRNINMDEMERLITEGDTIEERKLGAIWMLTALVSVSFDAAEALPHLIQNYE